MTELKGKTKEELIKEFIQRMSQLESEEEIIKEAKKDLRDEYKQFLDLKSLNHAIQVVKIKHRVQDQMVFENIVHFLEKEHLI